MIARESLKIRLHVHCLTCLIRSIMDAQKKQYQSLYHNLVLQLTHLSSQWSTFHTGNGLIPCGHSVNIHKRENSCQRIVLSKDGGRNGSKLIDFLLCAQRFFYTHNVPIIVETLQCISKNSRVCS